MVTRNFSSILCFFLKVQLFPTPFSQSGAEKRLYIRAKQASAHAHNVLSSFYVVFRSGSFLVVVRVVRFEESVRINDYTSATRYFSLVIIIPLLLLIFLFKQRHALRQKQEEREKHLFRLKLGRCSQLDLTARFCSDRGAIAPIC